MKKDLFEWCIRTFSDADNRKAMESLTHGEDGWVPVSLTTSEGRDGILLYHVLAYRRRPSVKGRRP